MNPLALIQTSFIPTAAYRQAFVPGGDLSWSGVGKETASGVEAVIRASLHTTPSGVSSVQAVAEPGTW